MHPMTYYTPPQQNFDGSPLRQALQAQLAAALEGNPDSRLWADRATATAKRCVAQIDDETFEAVMAHFSEAWFERRTWRDQAAAFGRLLDAARPGAPVAELVQAFGVPDLTPVWQ